MKKTGLLIILGAIVIVATTLIIQNKTKSLSEEELKLSSGKKLLQQAGSSSSAETEITQTKTDRPLVSSPSIEAVGMEGDQVDEVVSRMREAMVQQNEKKAEKLIAKLVEELGLSLEQAAELETYFADQVEAVGKLLGGEADREDPLAGSRAFAALEGQGLEEVMDELLTPEQKKKWAEREEKRVHRLADSGALKELASLGSAIDLSGEQRDAVYEHFYQKKMESEQNSSTRNSMATVLGGLTSGMGIEMDFGNAVSADFGALAEESTVDGEPIDVPALLSAQRERRIENQVEELSSILSEEQLGDYREHLESQSGVLDNIFAADGFSTIQIETQVSPIE